MEGRLRLWRWIFIVGVGLLMRWLFFEKSFFFAHDQDLYSWIAKDIVVNHHNRLVGQITSVDGVFIGSFYYYVMAINYWMFEMNPLSAIVPITILSVVNIVSIHWVVKRFWGEKSAWIATAIYAFSFGIARFDRWSVPTLPTLTWSIWFVAVCMELIRGNLRWLPLYGFLVGFVWQLHIALLPILPLPIIAYFLGKNKFSLLWSSKNIRVVILGIMAFLVTISPFVLFELKHNWSQIKSMAASTQKDIGAPTGKMKFDKVIEASGREMQQRLAFDFKYNNNYWYWIVFGVALATIWRFQKVKWPEVVIIIAWVVLIMLAQFLSKRVVSEYYFTNLVPLYILVISIFIANFLHKKLLLVIMAIYLCFNLVWLYTRTDEDQSYLYRRQVVEYIKNDVVKNDYPCVAINYIADPGVGVGFRYLFWYYKVNLVKPGTVGVPVYNISIPWQLSRDENPVSFGRFGVLLPVEEKFTADQQTCERLENQPDPLLGYTE